MGWEAKRDAKPVFTYGTHENGTDPEAPNTVCYQSLARVTCYEVANLFETEIRRAPN